MSRRPSPPSNSPRRTPSAKLARQGPDDHHCSAPSEDRPNWKLLYLLSKDSRRVDGNLLVYDRHRQAVCSPCATLGPDRFFQRDQSLNSGRGITARMSPPEDETSLLPINARSLMGVGPSSGRAHSIVGRAAMGASKGAASRWADSLMDLASESLHPSPNLSS